MARNLVGAANTAGGRDNISVLLVQATEAAAKRGLLSRMLGK
jgi:protein phosphatase